MSTPSSLPKPSRKKRISSGLPVLTLILSALILLFSADEVSANTLSLEARLEGLERTQPRHLRSLLDECLEKQSAKELESIDLPELDQCLLNSELFSSVDSRAEEVLVLEVKERWTLIPLPFFRSQEDSTNVGGFLMESNFLGRGQLLVLGATFGSLGNSYFAMLRDPSFAFTDWTSRTIYLQDSGDVFFYEGDEKIDGYHQKEKSFSLTPGYRFTPDFEGRAFLGFTERDYEEAQPFATRPENYRFWTAGLEVELDAADYKFYFSKGHKLELEIRRQFARSGEGDPTLAGEVEWSWQSPFPGKNILKVGVEGMAVDSDAAFDSFQLGGEKSLRGVQEKGLWAQYLAGIVLDYHIPVWEWPLGTWAAGPFLAYAAYRPPEGFDQGGWEDTVSYGAGLFFYLRKVAFPGVGVVAGRNSDFSGTFVTVQIGFSR
jgi:outer membrane protein assembly factor BamA